MINHVQVPGAFGKISIEIIGTAESTGKKIWKYLTGKLMNMMYNITHAI